MSFISDCPKCNNSICTCGYQYRDWKKKDLKKQIAMLKEVIRQKYKHGKSHPKYNIVDIDGWEVEDKELTDKYIDMYDKKCNKKYNTYDHTKEYQ